MPDSKSENREKKKRLGNSLFFLNNVI